MPAFDAVSCEVNGRLPNQSNGYVIIQSTRHFCLIILQTARIAGEKKKKKKQILNGSDDGV
jgi:hypothetical protein